MKNYQAEVYRYQPKLRLDNSSYHVKTEFNNYFIIYLRTYCRTYLKKAFVLFHIPTPSKVDVVVIGMSS